MKEKKSREEKNKNTQNAMSAVLLVIKNEAQMCRFSFLLLCGDIVHAYMRKVIFLIETDVPLWQIL